MSATPILIIGGYAYRLNTAGSLEHTEAQRLLTARPVWFLATDPTPECNAALAGLIATQASLGGRPTTQQTVREVMRINADRSEGPDAREIATAKGLKLWNGGGMGVVRRVDATLQGVRDTSSVHVFACAKSRAELMRMICAYNGVPGPEGLAAGVQSMVKSHWTEGAWGTSMSRIEPEPGIWVRWHRNERPVRVWPAEKAEGERPAQGETRASKGKHHG